MLSVKWTFGMRHEHGVVLFHNVMNELKSRITYIGTYCIVVEISKEHHNHISRHYVLYPLYSSQLYLNTSINSNKLFLNVSIALKLGNVAYSGCGYSRKYCIKRLPIYMKITHQDFRYNQRCFCLTLLN